MAITLTDEIADLERELVMRNKVYPNKLLGITDPRARAQLNAENEHRIACTKATIARLKALAPQQATLF